MEQFKTIINGTKSVAYAGKTYYGVGVSYETFDMKMQEVADSLGWLKEWLYAVMYVETAGTFSPSIKNTKSSATGLIQFMSQTAKGLGTTVEDLAKMNGVKQLDYVLKYFKPYKNKVKNGYDVYLAVFRPAWLDNKDLVIHATSRDYLPNRGIDIDNNGTITYENFIDWVNQRHPEIVNLFRVPSDQTILTKNHNWLVILGLALAGGFIISENKAIFRT